MPVRAPVLDRVREHVGVHERAPGLAGAELPELAPGVAQAERRLPGVDAGAEQLELEDRLELAERRSAMKPFTPRRLWRTPAKKWPSSPYSFSYDGSLVGRSDVEPVRVVLAGLVAHVEHGEAVDVHPRLRPRPSPALLRGRGGRASGVGAGLGTRGPVGRPRQRRRREQQRRDDRSSHDCLLASLRVRLLPRPHLRAGPRRTAARSCPCAASRSPPASASRTAARTCRRPSGTSPARSGPPRRCRTGSGPGSG